VHRSSITCLHSLSQVRGCFLRELQSRRGLLQVSHAAKGENDVDECAANISGGIRRSKPNSITKSLTLCCSHCRLIQVASRKFPLQIVILLLRSGFCTMRAQTAGYTPEEIAKFSLVCTGRCVNTAPTISPLQYPQQQVDPKKKASDPFRDRTLRHDR
jgi:hypothetical protein